MLPRKMWPSASFVSVALLVTHVFGGERAKKPDLALRAENLVEFALNAELSGRNVGRTALLKQALTVAPDSAPANWHRGYIRWRGEWRPVAEVEKEQASDSRLAGYNQRRERTPDSPAEQLELARWCANRGLIQQGQLHTVRVINAWKGVPPLQRQMADKLGFQQVGQGSGMSFVSREAALAQIKQAETQVQAWEVWSSKLTRIRQQLESRSEQRRDMALQQLRDISDTGAIPALEALISAAGKEMSLEVVDRLDKMPQHEATMSLARHAVFSPDEQVRATATVRLAKRRLHDYIPHLLAQLTSPIKTRFIVQPLPDGGLRYFHDFYRAGANEDYIARKSVSFVADTPVRHVVIGLRYGTINEDSGPVPQVGDESALVLQAVFEKIHERQRQIAFQNRQVDFLNSRIDAVLVATTGKHFDGDPVQWWQWWQRHNELSMPDQKQLVSYYTNRRLFFHDGRSQLRVSYVPSCFPAGTLVWSQTGRVPIETIQPGDFVLAQHPDTGELAYKIVLGTTLRPPTRLLKIEYDGGKLTATLGHPLWVSGSGWRMAKFVEVGDLLHGINGSVRVEGVEEVAPARAYNLIVDDFNSYLVGDDGLLVHDNTLRKPTLAVLPGLVK